MTPSEMLTLLGYRLEDPEGDVYTTALKVLMINRAQARVYTELNRHVVPELMELEAGVSLTSGAFDQTDLTYTLLGGISGGVNSIRLENYDFTHKISFEEYKESVDRSITFTTSSAKHYYLGSKCYVLPDDYDVDVYYKRQPVQITVAGYAGETFTVASELVHDAVAYIAESMCWAVNNDPREAKALELGANLIETLNTTITATDSNSISDDQYLDYDANYELPFSAWEV